MLDQKSASIFAGSMSSNRSFARRIGKTLSATQRYLLDIMLPKYSFNVDVFANKNYKSIFLEVGFGMGEHMIHQAFTNPQDLFIGAEVYLNGVANAIKLAQQQNVDNISLWADDLDLVLDDIPINSLSGIYLLFPDPWHKRRQHKNRFLNQIRVTKLQQRLKYQGFLIFVSDIKEYFIAAKDLIIDNNFKIVDDSFNTPHANYVPTKYHNKALVTGQNIMFLQAINYTDPSISLRKS